MPSSAKEELATMNSRSTYKGKSKEWVLSVIGSMIIVALCAILLIPGFGVVFRCTGATTAEAVGRRWAVFSALADLMMATLALPILIA